MRSIATAVVLVLAAFFSACVTPPATPQQVWVVRHAEKLAGDDPALSPAGEARARALRDIPGIERVSRIFSTDTTRTRTTAQPLAQRLGLPVEIYDHREPQALAEHLLASGESALIVGHSNTIGGLAAAFGVDPGPAVADDEYDRLYVITIRDGERHVERRRFQP